MKFREKAGLLKELSKLLTDLEVLYAQTTPRRWGADEVGFANYREVASNLISRIYKGNASRKIDKLDEDIEAGGAVVYTVRPDGSRDPRNHQTLFKKGIANSIKTIKGYRLEVKTTPLARLRWTRKRWLASLWAVATAGILTLLKELPDIIRALHGK